ncbi:MAG: nucleotidyltransferase domain-containing protein [Acidobacteria bacterium]|nr:nucleotidyltransferase domain-containing protein [Acidobacteriota bacterium]
MRVANANQREISDLCRQIVEVCHPQKVVLFGSYAYGLPTEDSDVDLMVVMPFEGHPAYQAGAIRSQVHTPLAVDLLVRTPQQIEERMEMGDPFMQEILEHGKVLYEADHNGMDNQSGERLDQRAA